MPYITSVFIKIAISNVNAGLFRRINFDMSHSYSYSMGIHADETTSTNIRHRRIGKVLPLIVSFILSSHDVFKSMYYHNLFVCYQNLLGVDDISQLSEITFPKETPASNSWLTLRRFPRIDLRSGVGGTRIV